MRADRPRDRITISPPGATARMLLALATYKQCAIAQVTLELVEEAIEKRIQDKGIPDDVLEYVFHYNSKDFHSQLLNLHSNDQKEITD